MVSPVIKEIENKYKKKEITAFAVGDTISVSVKIIEGTKERIQNFEGIVIARKGGGIGETFKVRKLVQGIGIEKTFPLHSDKISKIKVIKTGKIRRAKLYYLRGRVGSRATKVAEKATAKAK
ncbi:MAG: 50S ribosomal protein L19 [Candidatus Margulisbacteria bacterium]|nr:50S ribosomal protein L19 [Candidatus Margulisiibacteriota bacterium]MBU1021753.1 50S ribosomal protein L19 [Candidatus Margulisiibacteriota bacterium]MBU1729499.1 50S ribosomal protein L19 [Candidatus Margulisiibacteriota bacterium]MBU1955400.1 50S ribosomal protein L19 [Candidatus Margulisiibacteriota bacterium]